MSGVTRRIHGAFLLTPRRNSPCASSFFNLLNNIPLVHLKYDWKNDGLDPDENEQNFGTVTEKVTPKPAYLARCKPR